MSLLNRFLGSENLGLRDLLGKFGRGDFSENNSKIIRNSTRQFIQNVIFKFGSLVFTIILARILMPKLMGLYSLALATIVLFASFSDLGIGFAITSLISKRLGNGENKKAKGYFNKLLRWKIYLLIFTSGILLISSYFISEYYYHKPIFFALLAGALYIPTFSLLSFVEQLFYASEKFKRPLIKEFIFQIARLVLVPLGLLFFFKLGFSGIGAVSLSILIVVLSYMLALFYLSYYAWKKISFLKEKEEPLTLQESTDLKKFIYPLSATALMGLFFGYVDVLMLGHYISSEFIAYYEVAFGLVGGVSAILSFIASAALPTFSRNTGASLEKMFKITRNVTLLFSFIAAIFTYLLAKIIIKLAYGSAYLPAEVVLRYLSVLVIILPMTLLYLNYYISQKKTKRIAYLLLSSTILNVILNFFAINFGLSNYGEMGAVLGATIATIISRAVYALGFIIKRNEIN